jgi:ABC-type multidrug transport system ATPase subunit
MGASGAGKTTLLNCLTFRNTGKLKISGDRYLNGEVVNTDTLARISGYVQQDDLFIPTLKVKEHLQFQVSQRQKTRRKSKLKEYFDFRHCCEWTNI